MIKRWYHLSVKKIHGDGKGSYSYNNHTVCWKSWRQEPHLVLKFILSECEKTLAKKPGSYPLEIVSFNKI